MGKPWSRACPGASEIHQKGTCVGPNHFPCELVSVRGKHAVEMYGPGTLSRGTAAAARFISSMERARPIPKKALRACLRWMNERPIAFSQASCPYFPICTRFLMPGQPFSAQNRQNLHRRGAFRAFLCATPGGRRFDAHAGALLYIYAEALMLGYSIRGAHLVSSGTKKDKSSCLGPVQTAHRF